MKTKAPSERTRLKRRAKRGAYDRETLNAILDDGFLCNVAYIIDGSPYVTPTFYWRESDHVYWHGSSVSQFLKKSAAAEVCFTVMHCDALVLARSGFNHSVNYRSVMAFGTARLVRGREQKEAHLRTFTEKLYPGRWDSIRPPTRKELNATTILSLPLTEASAKIRSAPPGDPKSDLDIPVWAGVVPLTTRTGTPIPCPELRGDMEVPDYLTNFGGQ